MRAPVHSQSHEQWVEVIGVNPEERLRAVDAFRGHLVLTLRHEGAQILRVMDLGTGALRDELPELPAGMIGVSSRDEDHELVYRPVRQPDGHRGSRVADRAAELVGDRPGQRERTLRKTQPVPGYSASDYRTTGSTRSPKMAPQSRSRWPTAPTSPRTVPRHAGCTDTARTRPASIRGSSRSWRAPLTAVSSTASPTSAVVANAAATGGSRAACCASATTFTDFIAAADTLAKDGWADPGPDRDPRRVGRRTAAGRRVLDGTRIGGGPWSRWCRSSMS